MITVAVGFYIHALLDKRVVFDVGREVVSIDRYVREFYRQDAAGKIIFESRDDICMVDSLDGNTLKNNSSIGRSGKLYYYLETVYGRVRNDGSYSEVDVSESGNLMIIRYVRKVGETSKESSSVKDKKHAIIVPRVQVN